MAISLRTSKHEAAVRAILTAASRSLSDAEVRDLAASAITDLAETKARVAKAHR